MNADVRDQISRLIAELHALYRLDDPDLFDHRVLVLQQSVTDLAVLRPSRRSRGTANSEETPGIVSTLDVPPLYRRLARHIEESSTVRIATAFLSASDTNPLIRPLERLCAGGGQVKVLTSLMGFFNRPDTLLAFLRWGNNLSLRLYVDNPADVTGLFAAGFPAFHAKTLLFEKTQLPNVVAVGSANVTAAGLQSNVEWNYISDFEVNSALSGGTTPYLDAVARFDRAWNQNGYVPDEPFIERYREFHQRSLQLHNEIRRRTSGPLHPLLIEGSLDDPVFSIAPRPAQQAALQRLAELRRDGVRRFAIIAATGLGKTLLSAFEVRNAAARRVLFLAHRESILAHAMESYARVFPARAQLLIQGSESMASIDGEQVHVFAMVQTLSRERNLRSVDPGFFDYIVVDEFHHASAGSYRAVIDHFRHALLLGLTATPERTDGQDVLELCDRVVAYEARLLDAIDRKWLAPFQYYALHDPTDYNQVRWTGTGYDETELERALSWDTRAELIATALGRYQPSTGKHKGLAFCSNVGHAKWMARAFSMRGFPAEVVLGETGNSERAHLLNRLEDESDELMILCAVDVLSEGIDVPLVTHILLLRPTQSFTVFLQQIGRGLRLHPDKPFVTVLDFVGNFRKNYVAPLALQGLHAVPAATPGTLVLDKFRAPAGCYVDADTEVCDVWHEAVRALAPAASRLERLKAILEELAADTPVAEVRLPEIFHLDDAPAYVNIVRQNGGWLAVRHQLGLASDREKALIGSVGERFLKHFEQDLNPNRSYKMAVLHFLLNNADDSPAGEAVPVEWNVADIARAFLNYYRSSKRRIDDWPELARSPDPASFSLLRAVAHIKAMPLRFLSAVSGGSGEKFFELHGDRFALNDAVHDYWRDAYYRLLLRERVEYAEARYWYQREKGEPDSR